MTDQKLYELCRKFGSMALDARRKFLGLLPEVNRRRLFAKKGFSSIFEFAFKMAGVSEKQVRRVLNLEKKFVDKPDLYQALISGEISANKLVRVASLATVENQSALVDLAKKLPRAALEVFVKEEKFVSEIKCSAERDCLFKDGLLEPAPPCKSVHVHTLTSPGELKLSPENTAKLYELQNKGIDINQLISEMLENREAEITEQKEQIATEQNNTSVTGKTTSPILSKPASRYIPVKVRTVLQQEHGQKCAIPNCQKPAKTMHHTARFAVAHSHNPYYMAPLCQEHHLIAHAIDDRIWGARRGRTDNTC
jgi:hypothetical protein